MSNSMLRSYCNQKIILNRGHGTDEWSEPEEQTHETLRARVDWENKIVMDHHGQEVVSVGKIIFVYDGTIDYDDTFTIDGREHAIAQINRVQDFSANHWQIRIK